MYGLDTNIVPGLRKARSGEADRDVAARVSTMLPSAVFLSVITIMELEWSMLLIERRDHGQGAVPRHDVAVAQCCARLRVPDPRAERDALIAATAIVHGMIVVTRDVADLEPAGAQIIDPWKS